MDLLDVLVRGSVPVIEVAGWRTRERAGSFTPIAQLDHHTAAKATSTRPAPSLDICTNGRADLPGPLCNQLVDYHGRCFLISDGRANDSGRGSGVVLDELRRGILPSRTAAERGLVDDTDGNRWFWDTEVEYPGGQFSPNSSQLETLMRINVALFLAGGGPPLGHKEWTRRKPDPANVDMVAWRREFARRVDALAAMANGTGPSVAPEISEPTSVVAGAARHTLEGEPVMRLPVRVRLDSNGCGETGPFEGLDVPMERVLSVSNAVASSPNYGGPGEKYDVIPVGPYERDGKLVVQVEGDARHAGSTVWPIVTVAD
jgi:hypothetical protein